MYYLKAEVLRNKYLFGNGEIIVNKTGKNYGFSKTFDHPILTILAVFLLCFVCSAVTLAADRYYILLHSVIGTVLFTVSLMIGFAVETLSMKKMAEDGDVVEAFEAYEIDPLLESCKQKGKKLTLAIGFDVVGILYGFIMLFAYSGDALAEMLMFPLMILLGLCTGVLASKVSADATKQFRKIVSGE